MAALIEMDCPHVYPTLEGWDQIANYSELITKVNIYCQQISASKSATMHLVILMRSEIKDLIENFPLFSEHEREQFLTAFEERFPIKEIHVAASLLHPELINLNQINFYLDKEKLTKEEFLINYLRRFNLEVNFEPTKVNKEISEINNLVIKHSSTKKLAPKSVPSIEIAKYLESCSLLIDECPINYLTSPEQEKTYPILSKLAKIVLGCPATQNKTERSFRRVKLISYGLQNRVTGNGINEHLFVSENINFLKKANLNIGLPSIDISELNAQGEENLCRLVEMEKRRESIGQKILLRKKEI